MLAIARLLCDLFIHEQRQNEIVRREVRFAYQIAERGRSAQAAWAVEQFSHSARLAAAGKRRKLARGRVRPTGGLDAGSSSM